MADLGKSTCTNILGFDEEKVAVCPPGSADSAPYCKSERHAHPPLQSLAHSLAKSLAHNYAISEHAAAR
jgi:hypothetical protein